VLDDKNLGLDKEAEFVKPADLDNEINNADIMEIIPNRMEDAAGYDTRHDADDYTLDTMSYNEMRPESEKPEAGETPLKTPKKDTSTRKAATDNNAVKPDEPKEKKGLFKRLFGGDKNKDKDKEKEKQQPKESNDY
jgi:penicillin-binding protein 1A